MRVDPEQPDPPLSGTAHAPLVKPGPEQPVWLPKLITATIGSGPAADTFFGDNRNNTAVVVEDNRVLLVSTNSFEPNDWTCVSCELKHQLLPRQRERNSWEGGRQLIFLWDHNMPPILPSKDGKCPVILRIEGGLLREIGTYFLDRLQGFAVPEGSVIVIGSVTHLMEEGRMGYTKALVTETIRFTKCFKGNVHVVPFLPPPLGGTNDPELIRSMLDILSWMEKLQKWDLSSYMNAYRAQIYATSSGPEQVGQNTQRHKLPKAYEAYNDKVFICHPWTGIGSVLPAMDTDAERIIIQELMEGLASNFKWELDTKPGMERSAAPRIVEVTNQAGTEVLWLWSLSTARDGCSTQRLHSKSGSFEMYLYQAHSTLQLHWYSYSGIIIKKSTSIHMQLRSFHMRSFACALKFVF
jgi:hypothetical protein